MLKPYDHQAIAWINEDGHLDRECRNCPTRITGWGPSLRHWNEAIRPTVIASADRPAVDTMVATATRALEAMWTDNCTDLDRARVVVEVLYHSGSLNTKARRRPRVAA